MVLSESQEEGHSHQEDLVGLATFPQALNESAAPPQPEHLESTDVHEGGHRIDIPSVLEESRGEIPPELPLPPFDETRDLKFDIGIVFYCQSSEITINQRVVESFPEGFPHAAAIINTDPNFAIFRSFNRGRFRLILQDQAELMMLEKNLDEYDKKVSENPYTRHILYQNRIPVHDNWPQHAKDLLRTQQKYLTKFEEKLNEYDKKMIHYKMFRGMPPPSQHARRNMGRYFYQTKPLVEGQNEHMTYTEDLFTFGKGEKESWIEGGIANTLERNPWRIFKVC